MRDLYQEAEECLAKAGGLFVVQDLLDAIKTGDMQSFSDGRTWVVTKLCNYPRKRVLDVVLVVGDLHAAYLIEEEVEAFARNNGAEMMVTEGRKGWRKMKSNRWFETGVTLARVL